MAGPSLHLFRCNVLRLHAVRGHINVTELSCAKLCVWWECSLHQLPHTTFKPITFTKQPPHPSLKPRTSSQRAILGWIYLRKRVNVESPNTYMSWSGGNVRFRSSLKPRYQARFPITWSYLDIPSINFNYVFRVLLGFCFLLYCLML